MISCHAEKRNGDSTASISVSFTGDILLDRNVKKLIDSIGLESFYDHSTLIKSDFIIGNFENPATRNGIRRHKKFSFNADPEDIVLLQKIGFTHLNLSNNHSIDCGTQGLVTTAHNIEHFDIKTTGYGKNADAACSPVIITEKGITVAIFSSVTIPIESYYPVKEYPCICNQTVEKLIPVIQNYTRQNPDIHIVVQLHWGKEFNAKPSAIQKKQAHQLVEVGADIIVGHHPHVVQSAELYKNSIIFYSLGNYIFDLTHPETHWTIVPRFDFYPDRFTYQIDTLYTQNIIPKAQKRIK